MKSLLQLSPLQEVHTKDLISLSSIVGWEYNEKEVRTLLLSGKAFGYLSQENKVIACAAIIPYKAKLASIGMVIVHPDFRGLGLAKELVQTCMKQVSEDRTLMLIATEEGQPVYKKLGFREYSCVRKLICPSFQKSNEPFQFNVQILKHKDLEKVMDFDANAFGDFRTTFLFNRYMQSKNAVVVKNAEGVIEGYAFGVQQPTNLVIGPIVAKSDQLAWELIQTIASKEDGNIRIDLLENQMGLLAKLQQNDFLIVNEPPIMIKSDNKFPVRNNQLYAIAAQAYG